jgi:hypothetical protein
MNTYIGNRMRKGTESERNRNNLLNMGSFVCLDFCNSHSGGWGPNWVHSARRPLLAHCTCSQCVWGWRIWWMKIGRENRSTGRKLSPAPLWPPQIPLDQIRTRTRATAVGSKRPTAWVMERPLSWLHLPLSLLYPLMQDDVLDYRGHRCHDFCASVMFIDIVNYIHVEEVSDSEVKEILACCASTSRDTQVRQMWLSFSQF